MKKILLLLTVFFVLLHGAEISQPPVSSDVSSSEDTPLITNVRKPTSFSRATCMEKVRLYHIIGGAIACTVIVVVLCSFLIPKSEDCIGRKPGIVCSTGDSMVCLSSGEGGYYCWYDCHNSSNGNSFVPSLLSNEPMSLNGYSVSEEEHTAVMDNAVYRYRDRRTDYPADCIDAICPQPRAYRLVSKIYVMPATSAIGDDCSEKLSFFESKQLSSIITSPTQLHELLAFIRDRIASGLANGEYTCSVGNDRHSLVVTKENVGECRFFSLSSPKEAKVEEID